EGGALGMGGGPSGFMTARGAGNLLTVTTWWLAIAFFLCAIGLTIVGNISRSDTSITNRDAVGALVAPLDPGAEAPAETAPAPAPVEPTGPSLDDFLSSTPSAQPAPAQTAPAQPAPAQ
ncbi:MAG: preprotein translocase subunit SecG, partial [Brevundimonas sp.]|nr:preprotein translocase subunit SecG [Brevundimonas sp.]